METDHKTIHDLILRMTNLHNDLMKAGLIKTYHAMHEAVKQVGYEAAEIMDGDHPTKLVEHQIDVRPALGARGADADKREAKIGA